MSARTRIHTADFGRIENVAGHQTRYGVLTKHPSVIRALTTLLFVSSLTIGISSTLLIPGISLAAGGTIYEPAPGSTLSGSVATFQWDANGAYYFWAWVGSAPGSNDIADSGQLNGATSVTLSGLPENGETIYVSLFSWVSGSWQRSDASYSAARAAGGTIYEPEPGSTLPGSTATFQWDANGAYYFWVLVGSYPGGNDIANSGLLHGSTSASFTELPQDGSEIHVHLFSWVNGSWRGLNFSYTAAQSPAEIYQPEPGSTLAGPDTTFQWDANGVHYFWVFVGSDPGGNNIADSGLLSGSTSVSFTELPQDGSEVHVHLYSWIDGSWRGLNFSYTAATREIELENAVAVSDLSLASGENIDFFLDVPSNTARLVFTAQHKECLPINNWEILKGQAYGSAGVAEDLETLYRQQCMDARPLDGDAVLYVSHGGRPTSSAFECRSDSGGTSATCVIERPDAGPWFADLHANSPLANMTLVGHYEPLPELFPGIEVEFAVDSPDQRSHYVIEVPDDADRLTVSAVVERRCYTQPEYGGVRPTWSTDCFPKETKLSVNFGGPPTDSEYRCRTDTLPSMSCPIDSPEAGTWHVMLSGEPEEVHQGTLVAYVEDPSQFGAASTIENYIATTYCDYVRDIQDNAASIQIGMYNAASAEELGADDEWFNRERDLSLRVLPGWENAGECPRTDPSYKEGEEYSAAFAWEPDFPQVCIDRWNHWMESSQGGRYEKAKAMRRNADAILNGARNATAGDPSTCEETGVSLGSVLSAAVDLLDPFTYPLGLAKAFNLVLDLDELVEFVEDVRSFEWLPGPDWLADPLGDLMSFPFIVQEEINSIFAWLIELPLVAVLMEVSSEEIAPVNQDEFFRAYEAYTDRYGMVQASEDCANPGQAATSDNGLRFTGEYVRALVRHGLMNEGEKERIRNVYAQNELKPGLLNRSPEHFDLQQSHDDIYAALYVDAEIGTGFAERFLRYGRENGATFYDRDADKNNKALGDVLWPALSIGGMAPVPYVYNNVRQPKNTERGFNTSAWLGREPWLINLARAVAGESLGAADWAVIYAQITDSAMSSAQDGKIFGWFTVMIAEKFDHSPAGLAVRVNWKARLKRDYPHGIGNVLGEYFNKCGGVEFNYHHPSSIYLWDEFGPEDRLLARSPSEWIQRAKSLLEMPLGLFGTIGGILGF